MVESASITRTTSESSAVGSSRASCWLRAPAFFSVLPTVSTTSTPWLRATSTVASVQLSAMTSTRSGRRVCAASESRVIARTASSSWAGISTVQCSRTTAASSAAAGRAMAGSSGSCSRSIPRMARGASSTRRTSCACGGSWSGTRRSRANTCIAEAVWRPAMTRNVVAATAAAASATASPTPRNSTFTGNTTVVEYAEPGAMGGEQRDRSEEQHQGKHRRGSAQPPHLGCPMPGPVLIECRQAPSWSRSRQAQPRRRVVRHAGYRQPAKAGVEKW